MSNFDLMVSWAYKIPEQIEEAVKSTNLNILREYKYNNYFFTGTGGGSKASIDILASFLIERIKKPFYCHQDYLVPSFVSKNTLSIIVSYSGNTEESLFVVKEILERKAKVITISSDGALQEIALEKEIPYFSLPAGYEARSALPFIFFTLLLIISHCEKLDLSDEINETITILKRERDNIMLSGRELAKKLENKFPIFYGSYGFSDSIAERCRRQFAENGKTLSHSNVIPNMHHDEIVGYMNRKLKEFVVPVFIRDTREEAKIKKRFDISKQVLEKRGFRPIEIFPLDSDSRLARIFQIIMLVDFASIFYGNLMGFDPKDVKIISELKEKMRDE